jgi:hypothetical protein
MQHHKPFDPTKPVGVSQPVPEPNPNGGPRTPEGKASSSRNATRHGCCSEETLILKHEHIEDYKALEAAWFQAYRPKEEAECRLVQQLVNADWFLERANRVLAQVEAEIFNSGYLPINWTDSQHLKLNRFTRYQTARANAVLKCRKALEDFRKNRVNEIVKFEKHEIYKEKSKPEPTIEQLINQMRRNQQEPGPPK